MFKQILEKTRYTSFWLLDILKGGHVTKHFKDIVFLNDHYNSIESAKIRDRYLQSIIDHAVKTTSFYKSYKSELGLGHLPVINKTIIRENINSFISDKFDQNTLIPVVTSGSTGTPFKTYQDKNKRDRSKADTIYFAQKAGFKVGNRLYYLKIWSKYNKKNAFLSWQQNIVPVDVIQLDEKVISRLISRIQNDNSSKGVLGYSSAIEAVCRYLDKYESIKVTSKVNSIITMSEALNDYTKETLEKHFNSPVLSRYSNIENGIIAQQFPDNTKDFHINAASFVVEILDMEADTPVTPGEPGRIVVTDLFNYGMPMLRYDTGDIGVGAESFDLKHVPPILKRIEGRKLDTIYNTKGNAVSSYIVYKNMWQYTEITQYQLIQVNTKEYIFKINVEGEFNRAGQLIAEFKKYLGVDAKFDIEYVSEIPLLDSGKRKKVVNMMNQG